MISRLTLNALVFAIIGTGSLAFAANTRHADVDNGRSTAKQVRIVQLQDVVVTAKRLPQAAR